MLTSSGRDKSENDFMDSKKNYGEIHKKLLPGVFQSMPEGPSR